METKIEVDPKLFITCRLCLDELGIYQIVPTVKQQIAFCFDINVEPFDGLPQLICKKCESTLNNYETIKKKIVTKQNELIAKIKGSKSSKTTEDPISLLTPIYKSQENENQLHEKSLSKKKTHRTSSSSSDSDDQSSNDGVQTDECNPTQTDAADSWITIYKKEFVCRVCDMPWRSSKAVLGHFNSRHYTLRKKYKNIFKRHCKVDLYSFDEKPNITGTANNVVINRNKIIASDNPKFYIMYTPRRKKLKNSHSNVHRYNECSDSSDEEVVGIRNKKRRLYSTSSNETVVLDGANKSNKDEKESHKLKSPLVNECINIDDSSESETENIENEINSMNKRLDNVSETDSTVEVNLEAINDIITGCKNKYLKKRFHNDIMLKSNKPPSEIATQLKRKFLSVGRKTINNKKPLNCTPILRFMEYKNLDIGWQSRPLNYVTAESNFIRIMSRTKNSGENDFDEPGWIDYDTTTTTTTQPIREILAHLDASNFRKDFVMTKDIEKGPNETGLPYLTITLQNDANITSSDTRKLLNANPVANPKQLPKKTVNTEVKPLSKMQAMSNLEPNNLVAPNDLNNMEMCMPIITSTTSLAPSVLLADKDKNKPNRPDTPNTLTAEAPRIKVKSVTELMSKETLSRMQEPSDRVLPCIVNSVQQMPIQKENSLVNICINNTHLNLAASQLQNFQFQSNNYNLDGNMVQHETANKTNYVILDTFELPNTTTNSPFDYFRKLLQVHNITLLDIDVVPPRDFHCLLKFKVLFQQEPNKSVPVVLSLSLFSSKNVYLLTIKDRNQENINISKISANWQWEVLKVYRGGEVVEKILNNAQKVSTEVLEYTNSFLCLLKSINYIKAL